MDGLMGIGGRSQTLNLLIVITIDMDKMDARENNGIQLKIVGKEMQHCIDAICLQ